MEITMPDLQSELSKAITAWNEPAPAPRTHFFKPTNNVSRETFNFVKANPGITRTAATKQLAAKGFNEKSVSSLFVQFLKQGQMRESNGGIYTTQSEYTPLKAHSTVKAAAKNAARKADYAARMAKRRETLAKKRAALTELEGAALQGPVETSSAVAAPEFSAEEFVNGLTLKQAKAVYGELRKVFE